MGGVVVFASEEIRDSFQINDIHNLVSFHVMRQDRKILLYRNNCSNTCHPNGPPKKDRRRKADKAEWISLIAILQGQELNKEIQNTINSQIDYHISNQ